MPNQPLILSRSPRSPSRWGNMLTCKRSSRCAALASSTCLTRVFLALRPSCRRVQRRLYHGRKLRQCAAGQESSTRCLSDSTHPIARSPWLFLFYWALFPSHSTRRPSLKPSSATSSTSICTTSRRYCPQSPEMSLTLCCSRASLALRASSRRSLTTVASILPWRLPSRYTPSPVLQPAATSLPQVDYPSLGYMAFNDVEPSNGSLWELWDSPTGSAGMDSVQAGV